MITDLSFWEKSALALVFAVALLMLVGGVADILLSAWLRLRDWPHWYNLKRWGAMLIDWLDFTEALARWRLRTFVGNYEEMIRDSFSKIHELRSRAEKAEARAIICRAYEDERRGERDRAISLCAKLTKSNQALRDLVAELREALKLYTEMPLLQPPVDPWTTTMEALGREGDYLFSRMQREPIEGCNCPACRTERTKQHSSYIATICGVCGCAGCTKRRAKEVPGLVTW